MDEEYLQKVNQSRSWVMNYDRSRILAMEVEIIQVLKEFTLTMEARVEITPTIVSPFIALIPTTSMDSELYKESVKNCESKLKVIYTTYNGKLVPSVVITPTQVLPQISLELYDSILKKPLVLP